jgi:transposase
MSKARKQKRNRPTPSKVRDWRTERRYRAWALHKRGWKNITVAHALGVTKGAVSQWLRIAHQQGSGALRGQPRPGRPARLTPAQYPALVAHLKHSPLRSGFRGEVWTCLRVKILIHRYFNIRYSKSQVSRILKEINWTPQKPIRRQRGRDEIAIAHWRRYKWPSLKKG